MKHYLELTDGICVEAFPRAEQPEEIETDNLALDTTGEFLQMGGGRKRHKKIETCTNEEQLKLFLQNAHRLIGESDRIMSDSRIFLAPLPMRNGLAYTGTSGFSNPTLGIYIEWWRNNECAWTKDKFGELQPIYHIAGSPLSGRNACAYIGPEGDSCSVQVLNFSQVWHSFVQVNTHYTEAKQLYEAYSLEKVIEILFGGSANEKKGGDVRSKNCYFGKNNYLCPTMKKLLKNLGLWILVAMVAGVAVGAAMGEEASLFAPLGTLFIQLIKMLVVPLVAVSIISGAASLGSSRSAGKIGVTSILYILLTTVLSIVIAIVAGVIFKPGAGLSAEGVASIMESASAEQGTPTELSFWDTVIGMIPANPIEAFAEGNILQIIVFGLFLGFGIAAIEEQKRTKVVNGLNYLLEALIWCIGKVMLVAPLGVFGLMAEAMGTFGFDILVKVVNLLWVDLLAVAVMGLAIYPLTVIFMSNVGIKNFFREMIRPQVVAFSTASSMATLPVTMNACDNMGISKQVSGFVVPLGATINMTGNAIYYTLVAMFFAQFYGIELGMAQYIAITITASLGSIGQAGVPGPTLMVVAVLAAAGIPIEGLPLLYALDRIFDMIRTVLNITGDAACAAVTDKFANANSSN